MRFSTVAAICGFLGIALFAHAEIAAGEKQVLDLNKIPHALPCEKKIVRLPQITLAKGGETHVLSGGKHETSAFSLSFKSGNSPVILAGRTAMSGELFFDGVAPSEEQWVRSGIDLAREILAQGYRAGTANADIYNRDYAALENALVHWNNEGFDFIFCNEHPTVLAFTYVGDSNIYLCRRMFDESWVQINELAQTIIHEGAHAIGYQNECDATFVEVGAMRDSGYGVAYQNSYWTGCGLE